MSQRIAAHQVAPGAISALRGVETYLHTSGLPINLRHLVKLRASQINGCAYCIDMHWKDLRALGEPEHRLYALDAWREYSWYTPQERAALEWTDALTLIAQTHADDAIYERVRPHFTDKQLADLTLLIAAINAWNRLAISLRSEPGHYQSPLKPA
jgi:AhpD family alkylhydroperoxidase